ncbi:hypothetical protein GUITHDRAFT_120404 [Guillardia theta CCMP2712]|uniref:Uncharacterized protein n=1 Tax=Guillardia theta (strain CCMP2712) TaxID=905079 RepID=L1IC33_GUITC|nr:hypothetical protein GUITHDRAFT_120404 [Guillardia theta CCMP2712]EKX33400.1 hypothetical protein GUITHDRAFT_120404 [Guillardia theta CCMP2712]|eukprot:XP_005820380.1 hypothetical protein GUITHDRAFT_120404 [Guillardia theta CCMP2712]
MTTVLLLPPAHMNDPVLGLGAAPSKRLRSCSDCGRRPVFGPVGGAAVHCSLHRHREDIDLINPKCQYSSGCSKNAVFGGSDTGWKRMFCSEHSCLHHDNLAKKRKSEQQGYPAFDLFNQAEAHPKIRRRRLRRAAFKPEFQLMSNYPAVRKSTTPINVKLLPERMVNDSQKNFMSPVQEALDLTLNLKSYPPLNRTHGSCIVCLDRSICWGAAVEDRLWRYFLCRSCKNLTNSTCVLLSKKCESCSRYGNWASKEKGRKRGRPMFCRLHKDPKHVSVSHQRHFCTQPGCRNRACFGTIVQGAPNRQHCSLHRLPEEKDLVHRTCEGDDGTCSKFPVFGDPTERIPRWCRAHRKEGVHVDVKHFRCEFKGCRRHPIYTRANKTRPSICSEHKEEVEGQTMVVEKGMKQESNRSSESLSEPSQTAGYAPPDPTKPKRLVKHDDDDDDDDESDIPDDVSFGWQEQAFLNASSALPPHQHNLSYEISVRSADMIQTEVSVHHSSKTSISSCHTDNIMAAANMLISSMQKTFAAGLSGGAKAADSSDAQPSDAEM